MWVLADAKGNRLILEMEVLAKAQQLFNLFRIILLKNMVSIYRDFTNMTDPTIEDSYRKQVRVPGQEKLMLLDILDTAAQEGISPSPVKPFANVCRVLFLQRVSLKTATWIHCDVFNYQSLFF